MSIKKAVFFVLCWVFALLIGSYMLLGTSDEFLGTDHDPSSARSVDLSGEQLSIMDVDNMTAHEIMAYIRWTNSSACQLERDFGGDVDGRKSVCLDPAVRLVPDDCIVYSFGLNHDFTFDDAVAEYGCEVFAFDAMIAQDFHRSDSIHVYKFNLGYKAEISVQGWNVTSLKKTHKHLSPVHGSHIIDYVRFDTEDSDLRVIPNMIRTGIVKQIRQLAVVVHIVPDGTTEELRDLVELLQGLEQSGMVRFASNPIPSSRDWLEAIQYDGELDYEITW